MCVVLKISLAIRRRNEVTRQYNVYYTLIYKQNVRTFHIAAVSSHLAASNKVT